MYDPICHKVLHVYSCMILTQKTLFRLTLSSIHEVLHLMFGVLAV